MKRDKEKCPLFRREYPTTNNAIGGGFVYCSVNGKVCFGRNYKECETYKKYIVGMEKLLVSRLKTKGYLSTEYE